ncbi:hypothetical protein CR513_02207, partial [Mucuna pruriens]
MSNLTTKLKSLKLELSEDLIVYLVLISLLTDFGYDYLYLIHEKSQSLDVFKSFKAEVELQLGKKIKVVKFDHGGECYGRSDGSGEQRPGHFALFSQRVKLFQSLWGEALKTAVYILNRMLTKGVNKKFGLTKSQASIIYTFGVVQLKHDL